MDAFNPGGVNAPKPDLVWLPWNQLTNGQKDEITVQYTGKIAIRTDKQWAVENAVWRWRMPSVDDTLSAHVAAIPEKPWPAPPHPGPTETTEELGMRSTKGGYPEHQPKPLTLSEAIMSAPALPVVKYPHFVDAENALRSRVYEDINAERTRQIKKFGQQSHPMALWLAILGEEVGEACQAALHTHFKGPAAGTFRTEVLHAAAVAVAILEDLDRKGIK